LDKENIKVALKTVSLWSGISWLRTTSSCRLSWMGKKTESF